ncbi:hypothetical protein HYU40_00045 [Candidatus Woesearchaeota archaeon]|nr:hypothetical protein [Candidatus Woesearchaeota archaeon]
MVTIEEKTGLLLEKLSLYGLTKTGAKSLTRIKGIEELLNKELLPPNPMPTPPNVAVSANGRINPKDVDGNYRRARAEYLHFWIKEIDTSLTWPVYEALIKYCNSKVG